MTEELKPCPFCGGPAHISEDCGEYIASCSTECNNNESWHGSRDIAVGGWNTRAEPDQLKCPACAEVFGSDPMLLWAHGCDDHDMQAMYKQGQSPTRGEAMTEELKPCPFCGGKPQTCLGMVECPACSLAVGLNTTQTRKQNIEQWNTRAESEQGQRALALLRDWVEDDDWPQAYSAKAMRRLFKALLEEK